MKISGTDDTIRWYNENAHHYAEVSASNVDLDQIDEFFAHLTPGSKVLDAGCGAGRDTELLSQKGLQVIGLDISTGLLEEARKRQPNREFIEGNILSLLFSENSFDGVWSHASLLHLETVNDVEQALSEFYRILKKPGVLHVLVKAQTGTEKTAIVSDALSGHERFFQYFTKSELEKLLTDAGFALIKTEHYNEAEKHAHGRAEVEWLVALAKKS